MRAAKNSKRLIRVAIICGSWPPETCGVGDNTACLVSSINNKLCRVMRIKLGTWGLVGFFRIWRGLIQIKPDLIHIQYPSVGYGWSLLPLIIPYFSRKPIVVTLHEWSEVSFLRRCAEWFLTLAAGCVVLTNEFEKNKFCSDTNKSGDKVIVLPIGSSIPEGKSTYSGDRKISWFGLLRPNRGLEEFCKFASRFPEYKWNLIGAIPKGCEEYSIKAKLMMETSGVNYLGEMQAFEVAGELSSSFAAFLPYPDGASSRRSSLLASLANECPVITTDGKYVDAELRNAVCIVSDFNGFEKVSKALGDEPYRSRLIKLGSNYFSGRRWSSVGVKHLKLYIDLTLRSNKL